MADWSIPIDLYCERTDPSFWAEPLNAVSNAAFLLAAVAAAMLWRRAGARDWPALALIVVVFAIGLGSFAFHTLATRGAVLLDVVPITVFIYGYLMLALMRFLHFRPIWAVAVVAVFAILSFGLEAILPRGVLNGSASYLPAFAAMMTIGALLRATSTGSSILLAAGLFAVSLTLRTIDADICRMLPVGTHFLWHMLNAAVLYVLLRAAIAWRPAANS